MAASYWRNVLRMISATSSTRKYALAGISCGVTSLSFLYSKRYRNNKTSFLFAPVPVYADNVHQLSLLEEQAKKMKAGVGLRGRRFLDFASISIGNELFMTPKDFLESVMHEKPRPRFGHQQLSPEDAKTLVFTTPVRSDSSNEFFRKLNNKGLISYTEYLFLLCILTKPKSGFEIAFKMFDTDGNQMVDKNEFLVLGEIFEKRTGDSPASQSPLSSDDEVKSGQVPTTLTTFFFGLDGTDVCNFNDFFMFMDNLQTEILEMEFLVYSEGMRFISEENFARILLRFTDSKDTDESIARLESQLKGLGKGISFSEFQAFFTFVNNLEDFAIALRMYALAGKSIGQAEFKRAVKVSTGQELSDNVVSTVFTLFDSDGDNKLSHVEFLGVMKDRVHRGFRSHKKHRGWTGFTKCVSAQMNTK